MSINITIPTPLSEEAKRLAHRLGVPLDEVINAALTAYLTAHQSVNLKETLDDIYESEPSSVDPVLLKMQFTSLKGDEW